MAPDTSATVKRRRATSRGVTRTAVLVSAVIMAYAALVKGKEIVLLEHSMIDKMYYPVDKIIILHVSSTL